MSHTSAISSRPLQPCRGVQEQQPLLPADRPRSDAPHTGRDAQGRQVVDASRPPPGKLTDDEQKQVDHVVSRHESHGTRVGALIGAAVGGVIGFLFGGIGAFAGASMGAGLGAIAGRFVGWIVGSIRGKRQILAERLRKEGGPATENLIETQSALPRGDTARARRDRKVSRPERTADGRQSTQQPHLRQSKGSFRGLRRQNSLRPFQRLNSINPILASSTTTASIYPDK